MYRYGEVEAALAKVFDVDAKAMGALKGRIIHLQRLGIGPASPGRGKKIEYAYEDVAVWVFCLQLQEFGLDPSASRAFLDATWKFALAPLCEDADEDWIFYFLPNMMSRSFAKGLGPKAMISTGIVPASKASVVEIAKKLYAPHVGVEDASRIGLLNLTDTRRRLIAALSSPAT